MSQLPRRRALIRCRHRAARQGQHRAARSQLGSATVEFALVGTMVVVAALAVVQVTLAAFVRVVLIDCAGAGARYGALAGNTPQDGAQRASDMASASLGPRFGQNVTARLVDDAAGTVVEVVIVAPLPVAALVGPRSLSVTGHALAERP